MVLHHGRVIRLWCCSISTNRKGKGMPIWKYVFGMTAMSMYFGTPITFVIPNGVLVVERH